MRPLLLSLALCLPVLGLVRAQDTDTGANAPQLPVGQIFKQFEYPDYENGKLKATVFAIQVKGITLNRAEATDLRINIFDTDAKGGKTTVTSPKADLYVAERKMRTANTVQIDSPDMIASSQECDFDLKTKKFLLRTNVKVVLKHFDMNSGAPGTTQLTPPAAKVPPPSNTPGPVPRPASQGDDNSAPITPAPSETK